MTNIAIVFAILAAAVGFRVWLARFIDADHELSDERDRRQL